VPSFGPASSHVERNRDEPTRQMSLNKALIAFEQVISSVLLDRTNVRICHHSRPICVSDVMSRYASKQWKKVEEAIKDPEDVLIVEGFPKTDPEVSAIAVFATNVTTKKLQMAKKQSPTASS
jgi:hypothetical protein